MEHRDNCSQQTRYRYETVFSSIAASGIYEDRFILQEQSVLYLFIFVPQYYIYIKIKNFVHCTQELIISLRDFFQQPLSVRKKK